MNVIEASEIASVKIKNFMAPDKGKFNFYSIIWFKKEV